MRSIGRWMVTALLLGAAGASAQDYPNQLALYGTFTTSSKLFGHPNDPDETLRSEFLPLNDIFSAGIDYRRSIQSIHLELGIGVEVLSKSARLSGGDSATVVPAEDGFTAIPIELSGYFQIPIGTERLHFYMGGGIGVYFGTRHYSEAGIDALTVERNSGFGIHILSGIDVSLSQRLSIRSEVKFRDIQFQTVNRFTESAVTYNGTNVALDQQPLESRIAIDGMTLNAGLVFHF